MKGSKFKRNIVILRLRNDFSITISHILFSQNSELKFDYFHINLQTAVRDIQLLNAEFCVKCKKL